MPTPDVRVKLSAEGVAEVVGVFRTIRSEAELTSRKTAGGFGILGGALTGLKGILGGIGVYLGLRQLVQFGSDSLRAAADLGHLGQEIGTTTTRASALAFEAKRNGLEIDQFRTGVVQLSRNLAELRAGSPKAAEAFRMLRGDGQPGLTAKDFKGLDIAQSLDLVAGRMAKMQTGTAKTALALTLFGRSGAQMIPVLDDIGQRGLPAVIAEAERFGAVVSDKVALEANRATGELAAMKQQAMALAAQFVTGLTPDLRQSLSIISEGLGKSQSGWEDWGKAIGAVLRGITFLASTLFDLIDGSVDLLGGIVASVIWPIVGMVNMIPKLAKGDLAGAKAAWNEAAANWAAVMDAANKRDDERVERLKARLKLLFTSPSPAPAPAPAGGGGPETDPHAALRARMEIQKQQLEAEVTLIRARGKLLDAEETKRFETEITGLKDHYARRRAILTAAVDAEVGALLREKAVVSAEPDEDRRKAQTDKIDQDVAQARMQEKIDLLRLGEEERKAVEELDKKQVDAAQRIAELQGNRHAQAMAGLAEELKARSDVWRKEGIHGADLEKLQTALRNQLLANIQYDEGLLAAKREMNALDQARVDIQNRIDAGQLTERDGQHQIAALEKERLVRLRQLGGELLAMAEATGDPEKIAEVIDYLQQLDRLGVLVEEIDRKLLNLGEDVRKALTDDLANWLSTGMEKGTKFADAMRELAQSVAQSLRRIASEIIALWIVNSIYGLFSSGGSKGSGSASAPAAGGAGHFPALPKARGGLVRGPGSGTSDSILARLSDYEYVVRSAVVRRPGVLRHLEELNAGAANLRAGMRPLAGPQRFSAGGLVQGGAGGRDGSMLIGLDEGLVLRSLESPEGQRIIVKHIARNRRAIKAVLG
jgi:hypothetical protein